MPRYSPSRTIGLALFCKCGHAGLVGIPGPNPPPSELPSGELVQWIPLRCPACGRHSLRMIRDATPANVAALIDEGIAVPPIRLRRGVNVPQLPSIDIYSESGMRIRKRRSRDT